MGGCYTLETQLTHQCAKILKLGLGFKKYFRNTSWLLAERVLRMGLGLVVGIYIARHLGPQGFGVLSYVLSFVGLFMSLASLGITDVVIRELVNHPDRRNAILGTAFCLKLAGVLLMWLGIGIAIPFAENSAETNGFIILVALSIAFQAFQVV